LKEPERYHTLLEKRESQKHHVREYQGDNSQKYGGISFHGCELLRLDCKFE